MAELIDLNQLIAELQQNLADLDDAGIMGDGFVDESYLADVAADLDEDAG